jgi:hypothetical protein
MMSIDAFLNAVMMDPTFGGQTNMEPSSTTYETEYGRRRFQPPDLFYPSRMNKHFWN